MKLSFVTLKIVLLSLLLAGCGESAWINMKLVIQDNFFKPDNEDAIIKRETIDNIPYATISINFESSDPSIMVLSYVNQGDQFQWVSSNDVSIITQYGRVVQTIGFDDDILGTTIYGIDPLKENAHLLKKSVKYNRIVRIGGDDPWQINLRCEVVPEGPEQITIVELEFDTVRLSEKCKGVKWWSFKNIYWVDANDGKVWRSIQALFENEPRMELNTLKPYG